MSEIEREGEESMDDFWLFLKPSFWEAVFQKTGPTYRSIADYSTISKTMKESDEVQKQSEQH